MSIPETVLRLASHLVWPTACPFCGALGESACVLCLLPLLAPPMPKDLGAISLWAGGEHDGPLRDLVLALKYGGDVALGISMGRALGRIFPRPEEAELLVPVPLHRGSERTYNQSLALAKGISKEWGVPACEALSWARHRTEQTALDYAARKEMPRHIFLPRPKLLAGRLVVLVDDVSTTGTTFLRAASAVERGGGRSLLALSWTCTPPTKEWMRGVR